MTITMLVVLALAAGLCGLIAAFPRPLRPSGPTALLPGATPAAPAMCSAEVRARLAERGVTREQSLLFTDIAARHKIRPEVLWTWLARFEPGALDALSECGISARDLADHVRRGTLPDHVLAESGVGSTAPAVTAASTRFAITLAGVEGGGALPPIYGPGVWPADVLTVPAHWADELGA